MPEIVDRSCCPLAIRGDLLRTRRLSPVVPQVRHLKSTVQLSRFTVLPIVGADLARRSGSAGPPWGKCVHTSRRNLWCGGGLLDAGTSRRKSRDTRATTERGSATARIPFLRGPPVALPPSSVLKSPQERRPPCQSRKLRTIRCTGQETLRRCTIGDYGWRPRRQHCCCARAPSNHRVRLDGEQRQRAEIEQSARCRSCPCANLERRRAGREMASVTLSFKYSIRVAWPCRMIAAGIVAEGNSTEIFGRCKFCSCSTFSACQPSRLGHGRRCVGPVPMSRGSQSEYRSSEERIHPRRQTRSSPLYSLPIRHCRVRSTCSTQISQPDRQNTASFQISSGDGDC